jgi:rod shape-determining protein MreD
MRNLIAVPFLILAVIIQSSIISHISLLSGYADVILILLAAWALQERVKSAWHWALLAGILTSFVTRLPWPAVLAGYFAVVYIARALNRRVWQAPMLAMFSVTFLGTLCVHFLSFVVLRILGTTLAPADVLGLITLPSLLLNILFVVPIYTMMRDLSYWVYPAVEVE